MEIFRTFPNCSESVTCKLFLFINSFSNLCPLHKIYEFPFALFSLIITFTTVCSCVTWIARTCVCVNAVYTAPIDTRIVFAIVDI